MEAVTGYVEHIIFRNHENGYTVMNFISGEKEITCVGSFSVLTQGQNMELTGEYTEHPTYGKQFKVSSYEEKEPEDLESMERYLGSGAIRGIGTKMAKKIVQKFKEDTFRVIEEEPERLAEIKGISGKKAQEISVQVEEKREMRRGMLFLQKYGISLGLSVKVYEAYGKEVYHIIKENPYKLADDIQGVGFKIADEIAARVGIRPDSDFRLRSAILYLLLQAAGEGHTYLPKEELTRRCCDLLGVKEEAVEKHYMDLMVEKKIIQKETEEENIQIYASAYYYKEMNTAAMLRNLDIRYEVPEIELEAGIRTIEKDLGINLDELQVEAVKEVARNGLLIITGGPGTGKTTTINTMIKYFEREGMDIFLAAPTGRAAKRMSEMTGYEAKTIHRMLEQNGGPDGGEGFERNEQNPLETDVIIIDEMSMVDINLMHSLLKAVRAGTRLILVGDVNQLPSVGPGCVLKDMIDSNCFHVVRLTKIFRQASQSDIIVNAHKINQGERVDLEKKSDDFLVLKRYEADKIIGVILYLYKSSMAEYVGAEKYDIQVLTPMRKGALGVEQLNRQLQMYLNPPAKEKKEKEYGDKIFREGDKVMQTRNDYQLEWEIKTKYNLTIEEGKGIFNGDMGIIQEINEYGEYMLIEFDEGRQVKYPLKELEDLELAYAITIHKSQGSEYPAVILPLLTGPRMLMNRNLLYTAVTRAQKCVAIVGDDAMFHRMEANVTEQRRYSGLKQRLREMSERGV